MEEDNENISTMATELLKCAHENDGVAFAAATFLAKLAHFHSEEVFIYLFIYLFIF